MEERHASQFVECGPQPPRLFDGRIGSDGPRQQIVRSGARAHGCPLRAPGGILRHVIVRTTEDDSESVVTLVVVRNDKSLRVPVRALLASPEAPDGFFLNINAKAGPYMTGDDTIRIAGRKYVRERGIVAEGVGRAEITVRPRSRASRSCVTSTLSDWRPSQAVSSQQQSRCTAV